MYGLSTLAVVATIASSAVAALNDTGEYRLKTELKPHQRNKRLFENLYVSSYHTGAGLSDATFVRNASIAAKGFLDATNTSTAEAPNYFQEFDLGTEFPWSLKLALSDTAYSGWQPVRIDAGAGGSSPRGEGDGFFINSTGLQWNSSPGSDSAPEAFGGWIICDWWHELGVLFPVVAMKAGRLSSSPQNFEITQVSRSDDKFVLPSGNLIQIR
ncbi:hypothetical protein MBLNU13_g07993t1 [Cladosporium sp. NU13]